MDLSECVYIMHIFVCRSKILKLQYFCKISDGQVVLLQWKQNYKHFEFFIGEICESDRGYLGTIYIVHIHLSVKRYLDLKMVNFLIF